MDLSEVNLIQFSNIFILVTYYLCGFFFQYFQDVLPPQLFETPRVRRLVDEQQNDQGIVETIVTMISPSSLSGVRTPLLDTPKSLTYQLNQLRQRAVTLRTQYSNLEAGQQLGPQGFSITRELDDLNKEIKRIGSLTAGTKGQLISK